MQIQQIAGLAVFAAILSACADATISQPETRTPPTAAAFDGIGLGSGGRAQTDTSGTAPRSSGGTMDTSPTLSTCEERGGWTAGSGNRQEPAPNCADGKAQ